MFDWLRRPAPAPTLTPSLPQQPPAEKLILGLDLGEVKDFTALVALRLTREAQPNRTMRREYLCGLICRWPLRTGYEAIIEDVRAIAANLTQPADLVIDATGAGRPVVQMFRRAQLGLKSMVPVVITAGHRTHRDPEGYWNVAKSELVSALLSCAESSRIRFVPELSLAPALIKELRAFTRKVHRTTKNESFEHLRTADHDDMVMATALAVWYGEYFGRRLGAEHFFV